MENAYLSPLDQEFGLFIPTGEVFSIHYIRNKNCPIFVGVEFLEADILSLNLVDLNIILGMNWLSKHHACIDYYGKIVTFCPPGRPKVEFQSEPKILPRSLISSIQAKRFISKGCVRYLLCYG